MHKHPIKLGKEQDCGDCVHEFLCMDYKKNMQMIDKLSSYKLSYQRMFITLYVTVGTIILATLRLPGMSIADKILEKFGLNHLLGLIFVGTSILGYLIVKNLASTRVSEMFFCNSIRTIRQIYADQLHLPPSYPQLMRIPVRTAKSADYQMIVMLSIFNASYLACGVALFSYNPNTTSILHICVFSLIAVVIYLFLHIFQVEVFMGEGGQKFSDATVGKQTEPVAE